MAGVTDYQTAGFGKGLGTGKAPALLVIDMVKAYFDPASPLYAAVEAELASTIRLVDAARQAGLPVYWTGVRYTPGGADGGLFYKKIGALKCFDAGNPLGDFAKGLTPAPSEVVVMKQYASAFFGTSLASTLTANGIDCLYICGVTTSGCVRASALDALQNGFIPKVVKDACGDREDAIQQANLFDLNQKYADVIDEATALAAFKAYSAAS